MKRYKTQENVLKSNAGFNTRAGFQHEGILRQACYRDGAYHDKMVLGILRPEWDAQHLFIDDGEKNAPHEKAGGHAS